MPKIRNSMIAVRIPFPAHLAFGKEAIPKRIGIAPIVDRKDEKGACVIDGMSGVLYRHSGFRHHVSEIP
jgi:hypothetical protein